MSTSPNSRSTGATIRSDRRDTAVVVGVVALLMVSAGLVIAWAMRDGARADRAALVEATAPPMTFEVSAGRFSEAGASEEFASYYPDRILAHPRDTVRFTNPTAEDPHSVTFGLDQDRSNQPRYGTGASAVVAVDGPCVSTTKLQVTNKACDGIDDPSVFPEFNGQAYYNSGIIPPGGGAFDLQLAGGLAPGSYTFMCVIHPEQVGSLEVVPLGQPTQRATDLPSRAAHQFDHDRSAMSLLTNNSHKPPRATPATVQAGVATPRASSNRFLPTDVTIDAGETVTWINHSAVPHLAVFGGYLSPADSAVAPPTLPTGSSLSSGLFTTAPIGPPPYPRERYTLRFHRPGTYTYVCTFHPGMVGTVHVRPPE